MPLLSGIDRAETMGSGQGYRDFVNCVASAHTLDQCSCNRTCAEGEEPQYTLLHCRQDNRSRGYIPRRLVEGGIQEK